MGAPYTGISLFSGGGTVEAALRDAVEFVGAVEFAPDIADWYAKVHGDHVIVNDVAAVDYRPFAGVDYLHASPSCKKASIANSDRGETEQDMSAGAAVERCLREVHPRFFTLENVRGYMKFDAYKRIKATLTEIGYRWHEGVYNAADFAGCQTRIRLYLRAWRKDEPLPLLVPTGRDRVKLVKSAVIGGLFSAPLLPWRGWYEGVEDLLPTCPESKFADWQKKRLMTVSATTYKGMPRAYIVRDDNAGQEWGKQFRDDSEPVFTQSASSGGRAYLVSSTEMRDELRVRAANEPAWAQTIGGGRNTRDRASLENGRVVAMTTRCLARFQGLPDWYELPTKNSLASTIIGNGVEAHLQRAVTASLLQGGTQ